MCSVLLPSSVFFLLALANFAQPSSTQFSLAVSKPLARSPGACLCFRFASTFVCHAIYELPQPGLKCGDAAQFYKRQTQATICKQSPISDVFQIVVQLVVLLVSRLAAHSVQP